MSSFSFLHAADLHLDSPLRGLEADPRTAARIRSATGDALQRLVQLALDEKVAFVLLAGDLYDGDWRDYRTGHMLVEQLAKLERAGVRVLAISGNHDADQVLTRQVRLPGKMFGSKQAETHELPDWGVAVHGQSYATRAVTGNIARQYPPPRDGWLNIGLLHTACGSGEHENYAPCTVEQLRDHGYDYWALGHVHTRAVLHERPWIVFPGNLQGRHVNEPGEKGATLVRVVDGRISALEHRTLDVLRWARVRVDVTGAATPDAVLTAAACALSALPAHDVLMAVRLVLHGTTPAHAGLMRDPGRTRDDLRTAAAEAADSSALWLEGVDIETRPVADLHALRSQPGAIGTLIAAVEDGAGLPGPVADFIAALPPGILQMLGPDHPALRIAAGELPSGLAHRARDLLLAELALQA